MGVTYRGFSKKFNESIALGAGRLRPYAVGPPVQNEYNVVDKILAVRTRSGRKEYLTSWLGYSDQT